MISDEHHYVPRKNENAIQFAIQSVSRREVIRQAELRLWCVLPVVPASAPRTYWRLSIYRIKRSRRRQWRKKELGSSLLYGTESMWISFNMTNYLKLWHNRRRMTHSFLVKIHRSDSKDARRYTPHLEMQGTRAPFLLVFSDPLHHKTKHIKAIPGPVSATDQTTHRLSRDSAEHPIHPSDRLEEIVSRVKRGKSMKRRNICRRKPLEVNFADLNWDTWIIAPKSYQVRVCVSCVRHYMSC